MAVDPTRTLTLRRRFSGDMNRRWRIVRGLIRDAVVKKDALGLVTNAPAMEGQFDFRRSPEKVEAFMAWLSREIDREVLGVVDGPERRVTGENAWTAKYISAAYQQGMQRGRIEVGKRTEAGFSQTGPDENIAAAMQRPFHADRVGLIYTRAFDDLKGIGAATDAKISAVLSEGLALGHNPRKIAREMNRTIRNVSQQRSALIARTEVIRAHHVATINTYREAGLDEVDVQAEWSTAGDSRVCPRCAALEGKRYTLDEIEPMIPLHPNCRCVALPVPKDEK